MTDDDAATLARQAKGLTTRIETYRRGIATKSAERETIIRALRAHGWSLAKIAAASGVSIRRVQQIEAKEPDGGSAD